MTQNQNSEASQEYVKFDLDSDDSFSQDWLDAQEVTDDDVIVQNLPRIVAKIPALGGDVKTNAKSSRFALGSAIKKSGIVVAFAIGVILGRQFSEPNANTEQTAATDVGAQNDEPNQSDELADALEKFDATNFANDASASSQQFETQARENGYVRDDPIYRDLDELEGGEYYDSQANDWNSNGVGQAANAVGTVPINPFAQNFDEFANDEFAQPRVSNDAFERVEHRALPAVNQNMATIQNSTAQYDAAPETATPTFANVDGNSAGLTNPGQNFPTWSDLNDGTPNAQYSVASEAPRFAAQTQPQTPSPANESYNAAQGFGDYQPLAGQSTGQRAQFGAREFATSVQNQNAEYQNASAFTATDERYQNNFIDNSKFKGFNTFSDQKNSVAREEYVDNPQNSNYNRPEYGGAVATPNYNADAATEYVASNPEAPTSEQSAQPAVAPQSTPTRALRW